MADTIFSPRSAPLVIRNQGIKSGEHFTLDGPYLLTLEEFEAPAQLLRHTMAAPGFYLSRSGVVQPEHRPGNRPLHCHDCLELMIVLRGTLTQQIEGRSHTYTAGQCCILSRNIYHVEAYSSDFEVGFLMLSDEFLRLVIEQDVRYLRFDDYRAANDPLYEELRQLRDGFQKKYLDLSPLAASDGTREHPEMSVESGPEPQNEHGLGNRLRTQDERDRRDRPGTRIRSKSESAPEMRVEQGAQNGSDTAESLLRQILDETREQKPGFIPIVSGCIARLLRLLADPHLYLLQRVELSGSREDLIYSEVLRCLNGCAGRVDHKELERTLHYTRDHLNRIVRRRTGMSLVELGHEISLEKAAHLLRTTDKSIGAILQELHYTNRTYFYRIFHEKYGMTPKAYRENLRTKG